MKGVARAQTEIKGQARSLISRGSLVKPLSPAGPQLIELPFVEYYLYTRHYDAVFICFLNATLKAVLLPLILTVDEGEVT